MEGETFVGKEFLLMAIHEAFCLDLKLCLAFREYYDICR